MRHAINRYILLLLIVQKHAILNIDLKSGLKLQCLVNEFVFLKLFVGQHTVIEVEKVAWLRISKLIWLVNFVPNSVQIALKDSFDAFKAIFAFIEVSKNKKQLFT